MIPVFQAALDHSLLQVQRSALAMPLVLIPRAAQLDARIQEMSWKAFNAERLPLERSYEPRFTRLLEAAGKAAAGAVSSNRNAPASAARRVLEAGLPRLMSGVYEETFDVFATRAEAIARRILRQSGKADLGDAEAEAQKWLKTQTAQRIVAVTGATIARVKAIVTRGFKEGKTIDAIAKDIRSAGAFARSRAFVIARTEVVSASNAGNHYMTASRLSQVRFDKKWSSSADDRVRDTHDAADGTIVGMKEPFRLPGGRLQFPGDSTLGADASEIINCRCTTVYVPRRRRR